MKYSISYRSLTPWQRRTVATLRKNPNAIIIYGKGWGLSTALKYLSERGYTPNPKQDRAGSYFAIREIDNLLNSNVLATRILADKRKEE